jgi:shikimate kinase
MIVACGGGTPCFFDNMERMNAAGVTVYLDASIDKLQSRLAAARSQRPLIAHLDDDELRKYIGESLAKRLPYYLQARYSFNADDLDDGEAIARSVEKFVDQYIIPDKNT